MAAILSIFAVILGLAVWQENQNRANNECAKEGC